MRLSYIIPVYNSSKWLERCLHSLLNQGIPTDDYEIIAVDDGSTDDSPIVLDELKTELSKKNVSVHVVRQENAGASAARNVGLRIAKGNYIWWIDGDDFLEVDSASQFLSICEEHKLDILHFGCKIVYADGRVLDYPIEKDNAGIVFPGEEYIIRYGFPPNVWSALYRRAFLQEKNLQLKEGVVHEDLEFPPRAFCLAERVASVPVLAYCYYQTENSVMRTKDVKKIKKKTFDLLDICDSLYRFVENRNYDRCSAVRTVFINHISFSFSQSLRNYSTDLFDVVKFTEKPYYPLEINDNLSKKDKIKYLLINFSLPLYLFFLRLIKKCRK